MLDLKQLDEVIKKAIRAVENSKEQIYQIGEDARKDYHRVKIELLKVQEETTEIIIKVDELQKKFEKARYKLAEVSQNFHLYGEDKLRECYERADRVKDELYAQREKEILLRQQRDNLEQQLKMLERAVLRTEELISNIGVALKFLTNDLEDLSAKIGDIQQIQELGLSIIRAQEEERKRVAREIHDGPAQSMANIVMRAEFCLKLLEQNPSQVQHELCSLIDLVRNNLQDVRKIIFDLRPMVLDDLGLIPALKRYIEQYNEQYGIYVELAVFGRERRLDNWLEVALFRVIQESLTNIKKHSGAKTAVIKIEFLSKKVSLLIRDDGKGFDKERILAEKRDEAFGLVGMRERIQLLKGKLNIKSAPGQGTEISLFVPI
ncbi:sensor histidine kinase [Desulfofalx alkaliphila]|uniref:sensor histidine kinase n=1 Tax=Desulfofalx alkaliphila TaxID=105483 RepID=UPI0004E0EA48|nr:sensor histidine kinase [Desulfofalx alkaliphila]